MFAPHHALRAAITLAGRGARHTDAAAERPVPQHVGRVADEVLPQKPPRQWVLSLPFALRCAEMLRGLKRRSVID